LIAHCVGRNPAVKQAIETPEKIEKELLEKQPFSESFLFLISGLPLCAAEHPQNKKEM
jgi:hypothetical protein